MKDIALDLGVSIVTVSKVLHNHSDIGPETRKRVLRRMKELNYRPNLAARALVTGRMDLVGLIVPDLVHPFFAQVAKGLTSIFRARNYSLIIASSEDDPALERKEVEQMIARRVDAIILASALHGPDSLELIQSQQIPCVLLDRAFASAPAHFVGIDDRLAASIAVKHLIEIGCRTIAHIGGQCVSTAIDREQSYLATLEENGLSLPPGYVVSYPRADDSGHHHGYQGMTQLLQLNPHPDGVFCYNDTIALGAMKAILEAGLSIPGDIALIGCGNADYDELLRVPLSSIDQQCDELGITTAKLALSLLGNRPPKTPKTVRIPPRLIVRESSRREAPSALKGR